ncbi:MAG: alpha/beta hydrolase [Actinophytocola sp.]|uniref:alpha/beta hydrolase n=1 Tax=Actinophytocola sp. TaxID=1872138 RepID=UPI00132A16DE|nr:alpha/beta hydrolase [Actinophytocola sp.]MPZ85689.1 alpha/beta hydrolase [Actinophytocola sp.]
MSVTWSAIRDWDAGAVEDAAQQVKLRVDELSQVADELNWTHPRGWHGDASDRARAERKSLVSRFDDIGHEADPVKRALRTAADAIEILRRDQDEAEYLARHYDMIISDAGTLVTDTGRGFDPHSAETAERMRIAQQVSDEIARILAQASIVDEELAATLRRATHPAYYPDANGDRSRLNPPPGGSPSEINEWWLGLSEEERNELTATAPEWVGSTDGIPAEYRDTANRQVLAGQQADLTTQLDELKNELDEHRGTLAEAIIRAQIDDLEAKLRGLGDIQNRLENPDGGAPDAYLLGVDADSGQAIIAMGNPDTATNVATFVPGTGSGLDSINGDMNRTDSMAEAAKKEGSPSTSVITWVGYAAPQDLSEAARPSYADDAKRDLDRFQDGLRATHEGQPSHNTVIGHSYGSTVIGHTAASEGLDADDVVFVGSPGVGVDNAADLNLPPGHVHATVAAHDIIQVSNVDLDLVPQIDTDVHGPDPAGKDFGASVFESDPGTEGPRYQGGLSTEAHSQYWDDGNKALRNMGLIIAGKQTA